MSRRIALAGARWWYRWSASSGYRARVRRTTVAALVVVILSIVVAKFLWGRTGPGIFTPLVYAALFFAAAILFAVAILSSDEFVDELEASHPPRVRTRRGFAHHARRIIRVLSAGINAVDAMLIRNVTRESVARWSRALGEMLSGVPPAGAEPAHAHAGPLARPATPPPAPRPARVTARRRAGHRWRLPRSEVLATLGRRLPSRRARPARTRHRASSAPPRRNRRRSSSKIGARLSDPRDSRSRS